MCFMKDGASPHRTIEMFHLLEEHFNERIAVLGYPKSKNMGTDWPPYSSDLNPSDSFCGVISKEKFTLETPSAFKISKLQFRLIFKALKLRFVSE